jgi:Uncharacterised protein family (UPF0158)
MPRTILLSEVAAALQFGEPNTVAYYDRSTGQILSSANEIAEPLAAPDSHTMPVSPGREPLPPFTEQDELEIARQFTATIENGEDRQRLHLALSSGNALEAFEAAIFRCQIANEWFQYHDECLLRLARDWLESRGIPYTDDVASPD